jgi:hypothetical protein
MYNSLSNKGQKVSRFTNSSCFSFFLVVLGIYPGAMLIIGILVNFITKYHFSHRFIFVFILFFLKVF